MPDAPQAPLNERVVLQPMLSVRGGSQAVEFYKQAFGASELFRISEDGISVVARLAMGKAEFWVADESPAHGNYSPATLNGSTTRMVLIVDDPDAFAAQAVSAGAKVVNPVEDQPYGWRVGRVVDPFGHHWEIGKPIDDLG
jgi:PhnB protein